MEQDHPDHPTDPAPPRADEGDLLPYEKPTLTSYGSLVRLTRNNAGTGGDAMGATRMMGCL